jgi:hypothetical protein
MIASIAFVRRALERFAVAAAAFAAALPTGASASTLLWNATTGNFIGSPTWSYDNGGTVATTSNPFTHPGPGLGGENLVLIGNAGDVTLNTPDQGPFMDNSLYELRVGTEAAEANLTSIGGPDLRGNGTLTVQNVDLLLFDTDVASEADTGRLIIGGDSGITGTVNWNSTGELNVNGHLRIGQGGTGVLNQNGGTIRSGTTIGTGNKDMTVGSAGGNGTLNQNAGVMELGSNDDGAGLELRRTLQIGQGSGAAGVYNLGDGVGAAGSASFETWSNVNIGGNSGNGVLNIKIDGLLRINYADSLVLSSQLNIAPGGGADGVINQQGGVVRTDGLLQMGTNTGQAQYNLTGSTGMVNVRAISASATSSFTFNLDAGGATKITVEGNTNTAGDFAAGNSISLSNTLLNITGLNNWASSNPITLFEQLDSTASLSGTFGNVIQGQVVGQNASAQNFYLNLFGGDGNDIVLQSTLPASSTDGLVWNVGAANFSAGWASGNGAFGVAATGVDPFAGLQNLYLGNNGTATYDAATNDASGTIVRNIYVGTNRAAAVVAGRNGNGTLTVNGSESLTVDDAAADGVNGMVFIGEAGFTGTVNWNSSGTFDVQGQLRIGRTGGTGVFNQTAGVVQAGTTGGGGKFIGVGEGAGSTGTYNLNAGQVLPDGLGAGGTLRQFRVGIDGGTGTFNVGDGSGAADSALFQSEDDLWVGNGGGGTGRLNLKSDGLVELKTDGAVFQVGSGGGNGLVVQEGGRVVAEGFITIGQGAGSVGEYRLSAGSLTAAADGTDVTRVGASGGNGAFRISGTGSYSSVANMIIGQSNNSGATGLVELTGSQASFTLGRLENHLGNDETIRWVADAGGITTMLIQGGSGTNRIQLQNPNEVTANTGTNGLGDLMGDGIALSLDLSALVGSQTLTLIDNRSAQAIVGFFENGTTGNLYEEGEQILGTGYSGTVTISYLGSAPTGSAGNDVVLNLVAGAANNADFDADGDVDGNDFLRWQRGVGTDAGGTLAQGDANGDGAINGADLGIWRDQFGSGAGQSVAAAAVPEPGALVLCLGAICLATVAARRRNAG